MIWPFSRRTSKKFLGIDIGTSAIKIVELSKTRERVKLENYGEMIIRTVNEKPFRTFERSTLLLSDQDIAEAINNILAKAQIVTKDAFFCIPDFSTFFSFLELPPMTQQELPSAVQFEARQHIPIPLSEVILDWSIIEDGIPGKRKSKLNILLVAVPHEIINQYQAIAKLCQIRALSLEAEVFGLVRSLIKNKKNIIGLVDIGAQSTTFNIVENGSLKITHSFDISGNELTSVLSKSLNIGYNEAEVLKRKYGVRTPEMPVGRILTPFVDLLAGEIDKISRSFHKAEGKEIEKIILAGGLALLPGLNEYLSNWLKKPIEIGNPFVDILYPPDLEEVLKEMGPSYAIAVGTALRGFE